MQPVRRDAEPWTPHVHRLLRGLRGAGVAVAPEPGAYVPGDCPHYPLPDWVLADAALVQVAAALRAVHDASARLSLPRSGWQVPAVPPADVVCHGDTSPDNSVWRDGRLVAFIDWEHAVPAPRGWDLGYAAYRFVPLLPGVGLTEQRRRLALFCAAYGGADPDDVLRWALRRIERLAASDSPHRDWYVADGRWLRTLL